MDEKLTRAEAIVEFDKAIEKLYMDVESLITEKGLNEKDADKLKKNAMVLRELKDKIMDKERSRLNNQEV